MEWERAEDHGGTPEQGLAPTTPAWSSWHTAALPALLRHRFRAGCHGQGQCGFGAPRCISVMVLVLILAPVPVLIQVQVLVLLPVPYTGQSTYSPHHLSSVCPVLPDRSV